MPPHPEVVAALTQLRRTVDDQNARLAALAKEQERVPLVLRHVVEIRRHLGLTTVHEKPAGHSRRRPMGA
jgi:hypothetical protein